MASVPLTVLLSNARGVAVETIEVKDAAALVSWLVKRHAEPRGRCAQFYVRQRGESLRVIVVRDGLQWGWRHFADVILPRFERARRVATLPRLTVPAKRGRRPAAA